jgi:hypothetical protein
MNSYPKFEPLGCSTSPTSTNGEHFRFFFGGGVDQCILWLNVRSTKTDLLSVSLVVRPLGQCSASDFRKNKPEEIIVTAAPSSTRFPGVQVPGAVFPHLFSAESDFPLIFHGKFIRWQLLREKGTKNRLHTGQDKTAYLCAPVFYSCFFKNIPFEQTSQEKPYQIFPRSNTDLSSFIL